MSPTPYFCRARPAVLRGWIFALLLALRFSGGHGGAADADKPEADGWAFRPAVRPSIPAVKHPNRARNPIDYFVLARLETEKLAPSKEADRLTLIRRLSFDLTG